MGHLVPKMSKGAKINPKAARQFHWHEIRRRRKARAGKNSFPPTPFLFARPSVQFGARSAPSIPFKIGSDFVKQTHHQTDSKFEALNSKSEKILILKHLKFRA